MLLFVAALSWIPEDIKKRTSVTIKANGEQGSEDNK